MRVEQYDEATYDFITNINIRGAFFLSLAVGRHMIKARSGSQINIDSINSNRPLRRVAPYAMSKAAMSQMTRSLAMEWGPYGVRVNSVAPGFIATDLAKPLLSNPTINEWREKNTPLGRVGTPEDIANVTIFLASKAAGYVTGQVLYVDGGTTCGLFWPLDV
jgi:NAD(P)-dependent dehydrogenase (short-subunit alcohol dehydrogenase family)